jgi:hypothetical protein
VRTVNFTHETRVANEALQCITVGCDKQRFGFNPECYDHATVRQRARRESARRAVETRRRNNPDWGRPNDTARYECWKAKAHAIVHLAVEQGILPSLRGGDYACSDCGGVASEYDHRDYAAPLVVEPVCRRCNILRGSAAWPHPARFQFAKLAPPATQAKAA